MTTETQAYSISKFCEAHSISRAKFYLLCKEGQSPKIMRVGRRRLISVEAAKEWRECMEKRQCANQ